MNPMLVTSGWVWGGGYSIPLLQTFSHSEQIMPFISTIKRDQANGLHNPATVLANQQPWKAHKLNHSCPPALIQEATAFELEDSTELSCPIVTDESILCEYVKWPSKAGSVSSHLYILCNKLHKWKKYFHLPVLSSAAHWCMQILILCERKEKTSLYPLFQPMLNFINFYYASS